jgi:hypothetical protein
MCGNGSVGGRSISPGARRADRPGQGDTAVAAVPMVRGRVTGRLTSERWPLLVFASPEVRGIGMTEIDPFASEEGDHPSIDCDLLGTFSVRPRYLQEAWCFRSRPVGNT